MPESVKYDVRLVQSRLRDLGFDPGPIDGIQGPLTDAAIVAFKRSIGFMARPYVGPLTLAALFHKSEPLRNVMEPEWVTYGKRVMGLHEVRDRTKLMAWLRSDGHALGDPSKLPWCGDFVETCIRLALPREPLPGALGQNPYWAKNWCLLGHALMAPAYGAVGVTSRTGGNHVFFFVGEDDRSWYCLGGNQSNTVSIITKPKGTSFVCIRWPNTAPPPQQLPRLDGGQSGGSEA